jgi:hypothetical protein
MPRISPTKAPNEKRTAKVAAGPCAGVGNMDTATRTKAIPNRSWLQNSQLERGRFSQGQTRTARPRTRDNPPSATKRAPKTKNATGKKPGINSRVQGENGSSEIRRDNRPPMALRVKPLPVREIDQGPQAGVWARPDDGRRVFPCERIAIAERARTAPVALPSWMTTK